MEVALKASSQFKSDGIAFIDPAFSPCSQSIGGVRQDGQELTWRRTTEMNMVGTFAASSSAVDSLKQGQIGDCWFLSACLVLASQRREILESLFLHQDPEAGVYCCKFFKMGEWVQVTIDNHIPVSLVNHDYPMFASSSDGSAWLPLIEKAYAKLHGCYGSLIGGCIGEALSDLTGCPVTELNLVRPEARHSVVDGSLWKEILANLAQGHALCCGLIDTHGERQQSGSGIASNHAYAIMDARIVKTKAKAVEMLCIRDPRGYELILKDPAGDEARKTLAQTQGKFWISFNQLVKEINRLYFCHTSARDYHRIIVDGCWEGESAGGCTDFPTFRNNPQFRVHSSSASPQTQEIFVSLCQRDKRGTGQKLDYNSIGIAIIKHKTPTTSSYFSMDQVEIVTRTSYWNSRDVSAKSIVADDGSVVIIPSCYEPKIQGAFRLILYCKSSTIQLSPSKDHENVIHHAGKWKGNSAGGGMGSHRFACNPQYIIDTSADEDNVHVRVLLKQNRTDPKKKLIGIGLYLFRNHPNGIRTSDSVATAELIDGTPTFTNLNEICREFRLSKADCPSLLIPATYVTGDESDFELTIVSPKSAEITVVPATPISSSAAATTTTAATAATAATATKPIMTKSTTTASAMAKPMTKPTTTVSTTAKPAAAAASKVSSSSSKPTTVTTTNAAKPSITKPAIVKPATTTAKPAITKPAITKPSISKPFASVNASSTPSIMTAHNKKMGLVAEYQSMEDL